MARSGARETGGTRNVRVREGSTTSRAASDRSQPAGSSGGERSTHDRRAAGASDQSSARERGTTSKPSAGERDTTGAATPAKTADAVPGARSEWRQSPGLWPGEYWFPQIEVFQRDDEFVVRADLPGLRREDVTVEAADDALTIHGERRSECEQSGRGFYRSERSYGSFHRRIAIPEGVDVDSATARFKNGVLEVTMRAGAPPTERGRRVAIRGDEGDES